MIFETLSLLKRVGFCGSQVKYFAYGGNLDTAVLTARNIVPIEKVTSHLPDHRLVFDHAIPFKGTGMASVEPHLGHSLPGAVYAIHWIDMLRMDCMESRFVFRRYLRRFFRDETRSKVFYYQSNRRKKGLRPTKAYLEKLVRGYSQILEENSAFLRELQTTPTIEGFVPKDAPEFLIQRYDRFGVKIGNWLRAYDRHCVKIFSRLIFKPSIFDLVQK